MCKKKDKLTDEQKCALKVARREKRSAFLSRMVDEFKKVGFIATFVFCIIVITWCMTLYTLSLVCTELTIIPSVATALQIISVTAFGIIGTAFAFYCNAASRDKDSLNKNGLIKGKDGVIQKAAESVSTIIKTVTGNTATTTTASDESDDGEAKG